MESTNKIILTVVAIAAIGIGAYTINNANASHSFEQGAAGGTLPVATTVVLAGQVMQPGDYIPLADFSPNFVAGHLLVRIPCDANAKPLVVPIAGHVDEIPDRTYMAQAQLNYISHVSAPGKTCVYHSHIPAVDIDAIGHAGAPRVTDIGLINVGTQNVVFRTGNAMSFTIHNVLGDINPPNHYGPGSNLGAPYNAAGVKLPVGFVGTDSHH